MKRFFVFVLIFFGVIVFYLFYNKDIMKKDSVTVSACENCEYIINNHNVKINGGIVYINGNKYDNILEVKAEGGILILLKENSVIGYNEKELFNYQNGFDSSYPGAKIDKIKVENTKIIINTTRLIDERTLDVGTIIPICKNDNLNYDLLSEKSISLNEPIVITYHIDYSDSSYKPVASYKLTLANYFKKISNCKTS